MLGLRQKLALGFGGLLLITLLIGVQSIMKLSDLGQSIDVILRENYRSVIACQDMKEALERVDSGVLFTLLGYGEQGVKLIEDNLGKFDKALQIESGNITMPGEGDACGRLTKAYAQYKSVLQQVRQPDESMDNRRATYFAQLLPLFQETKDTANYILHINQQNMSDANMIARHKAEQASQRMYLLLICGFCIALTFIYYARLWILRPITALTASANEIAHGNLDLVVGAVSRDELGQLSEAFDTMASSLREYRRTNETKMINMQRATQQALESLSAAIVVVDLEGNVDVVTKPAHEAFELPVGSRLAESKHPWMEILVQRALKSGRREQLGQGDYLVQVFVEDREKFYRPEAIPVLDVLGQMTGVTLMLHDATEIRQQDEIKRDMVATVSHQLKTPLTSIRMALYLLLDNKLGPLTAKQEELLDAARDDSDRLCAIVEDLLDIARIQSGRIQMDIRPIDAGVLALDSLEPFKAKAQDCGITLATSIPDGLPEVKADTMRINYVFANLLSNALKYTAPGGRVTLSAVAESDAVWFSVADTGQGIASEHLPRVFDQFYRVPDQGKTTGAGLGLAIAKEIVDAHGGHINVESQVGQGTTFKFSLPRASASTAPEVA